MRLSALVFGILVFTTASNYASAQLPAEGVVFDDFDYSSTEWCHEISAASHPDSCQSNHPPEGSLFGSNKWYSNQGNSYDYSRMWYWSQWQEPVGGNNSPTELVDGLSFMADPTGHGELTLAVDSGVVEAYTEGIAPLQIMSGHAARRGTWASKVIFSDLTEYSVSDIVQAFWLISLNEGLNVQFDPDKFVTNEIDFEWNNRFSGTGQQNPNLRTGHTGGDLLTANSTDIPLVAPSWPDNTPGDPSHLEWSCKLVQGQYSELLETSRIWNPSQQHHDVYSDCSDILMQKTVAGVTPYARPSIILYIRVSDTSVKYDIASHGWGGTIVASAESDRITSIDMATVFSVRNYLTSNYPNRNDMKIDWMYYTPSTNRDINQITQDVDYIRTNYNVPRYNSTGEPLQRPVQHLTGFAETYGYGQYTSPLTLEIIAEDLSPSPGETQRIFALPPTRHGKFKFDWCVRRYFKPSGNPGTCDAVTPEVGGWYYDFTYPTNPSVSKVEVEVTLTEYDLSNPHQPITDPSRIASPITNSRTFGEVSSKNSNLSETPEIHPNPVSDRLRITLADQVDGNVHMRIFDALGRLSINTNLDMSAGYMDIDVGHLSEGVYFYSFVIAGTARTGKFIIAK